MTLPKIYVAIDTPDLETARKIASCVVPVGCGLKLGLEFFNANGPQGMEAIKKDHPDVSTFFDLKYHDIPNTVAGAVRSISRLCPDFLNIHASGGADMMKAAKDALGENTKTKLLAVTVLTSLDDAALLTVGQAVPAADQVRRLALLTQQSGLDGIVCSPLEVGMVREVCGSAFVTMVPGIRPADAAVGDQKRVMTPKAALEVGVHHMVIGRPITQASDPAKAASAILQSLLD